MRTASQEQRRGHASQACAKQLPNVSSFEPDTEKAELRATFWCPASVICPTPGPAGLPRQREVGGEGASSIDGLPGRSSPTPKASDCSGHHLPSASAPRPRPQPKLPNFAPPLALSKAGQTHLPPFPPPGLVFSGFWDLARPPLSFRAYSH